MLIVYPTFSFKILIHIKASVREMLSNLKKRFERKNASERF